MRIILILSILFLVGCKTRTVYVPVETETIRTETETIRDTIVDVKLVPYYEKIVTEKDSSYLENEYAFSSAKWDGSKLHHSLGIFDKITPVKIQYKDRYFEITKTIREPYPVERNKTIWEKAFELGGKIFFAILGVFFAYFIVILIKK